MSSNHGMIPGTHEWPRTPQCRCGADWDRWNDRCCRNGQANERIGGTDE